MDSDQRLIEQASAGRREAFDELVRRYQRRVYTLARVLVGNDDQAQDLAQETFIRAFRSVGRFRGDSSFGTWLHRIAVNLFKTQLRQCGRKRRQEEHSMSHDDESMLGHLASSEDMEQTIARRLIIDRALAALPEHLRLLVTLRDIQGLEYREIAQITGLPMGSVASGVSRARRRLRPMLASLLGPARDQGPGM